MTPKLSIEDVSPAQHDFGPGLVAVLQPPATPASARRVEYTGDDLAVSTIDSNDLAEGGPTWDTVDGAAVGGSVVVSLLSDTNEGGTRNVAVISLLGTRPGTFTLKLADGTLAARDTLAPPYLADVPIATPVGTTLIEVTVGGRPIPTLPGLLIPGFAMLLLATGSAVILRRRA